MWDYNAKYLENYDGDTISFSCDLGFNIHHILTVRLLGCDTYEMKDKDLKNRELAKQAKELVQHLLSNASKIQIHTEKDTQDKYGRYLAKVTVTDKSGAIVDLTQFLITANLTTGKWTLPA